MRLADLQLILRGSASGEQILRSAAAASGALTFPAGTTDFSGTGGASQVVKQLSAGGAFTVAQLSATELSGLPVSVGNGGTGLTTGTSGGVPYYTAASTMASSAAFPAGALIKGQGAGNAPVASNASVDSSGNMTVTGGIGAAGIAAAANLIRAPYLDATQNLSCTVDAYVGGILDVGANAGVSTAVIELGGSRSADGQAAVDFHAQAGTDYDFRILRGSGANGDVTLQNNGTGVIQLVAGAGASAVAFNSFAILSCSGRLARPGTAGPSRTNSFNIDWAPGANLWVDTSNLGAITLTSDYRIKENIAELPSTWGQVKTLRPISYNIRDTEDGLFKADPAERWGFIAHELQDTLIPSAASGYKDEPNLVQSPDLLALLAATTRALQEAMARIEALERRLS